MSTYLLLRNNKESGPFTIDEIKRMSLKSYDLVWIEGKSAAWRYPGEISEFTSFAPPVPEQPYDRFYKKAVPESASKEINVKQSETVNGRPASFPNAAHAGREEAYRNSNINPNRDSNNESVYINLPALDKKRPGFIPAVSIQDHGELKGEEPVNYPDNIKMTGSTKRAAGKGLLIVSIILLFGAGMFTGFFISNRRNFYSTDGNPPHVLTLPVKSANLPQKTTEQYGFIAGTNGNNEQGSKQPSGKTESNTPLVSKTKKKSGTIISGRKDSLHTAAMHVPVLNAADSFRSRQESDNKTIALAAKIKAHPEEYLLITPGKYKVGVLGGISEVPLSLINRSGVPMDLVVVAVDYILHNKKIFKTENLSFHNLAPGTTVTGEAPKSSRGVKITYRLTIANSQQIGMSYSNL